MIGTDDGHVYIGEGARGCNRVGWTDRIQASHTMDLQLTGFSHSIIENEYTNQRIKRKRLQSINQSIRFSFYK